MTNYAQKSPSDTGKVYVKILRIPSVFIKVSENIQYDVRIIENT